MGKEKEQDKYVLCFDDLTNALKFVKNANRIIEDYGVISWAVLLNMANPYAVCKRTDDDIVWTKKFVFYECLRTNECENLVKFENYDCMIKVIFPEPNKEL